METQLPICMAHCPYYPSLAKNEDLGGVREWNLTQAFFLSVISCFQPGLCFQIPFSPMAPFTPQVPDVLLDNKMQEVVQSQPLLCKFLLLAPSRELCCSVSSRDVINVLFTSPSLSLIKMLNQTSSNIDPCGTFWTPSSPCRPLQFIMALCLHTSQAIFHQVSQLVSTPIQIHLPGMVLQGTLSNTLLKVASRYLHFSSLNTNGSIREDNTQAGIHFQKKIGLCFIYRQWLSASVFKFRGVGEC